MRVTRSKLNLWVLTEVAALEPAGEIALYTISEPLEQYDDVLVEDADGMWWWGDGYPILGNETHT